MGKGYKHAPAPSRSMKIGNTHSADAEGLEPPTRARWLMLDATNAQKEPRFPGAITSSRWFSQITRTRAAGSNAPSCGPAAVSHGEPNGSGAARMWPRSSAIAHRPQPTGRALRTWLATRSCSKSPASRWVQLQIRPARGTPTDEAGSPQPQRRATATSSLKADAALLLLAPRPQP